MSSPVATPATPVLAPNWWLGILPAQYWEAKKIPFVYEVEAIPLAVSGAVQTFSTPIRQDSDFLLLALAALVTSTANPPGLLWGSGFTQNAMSQVQIQVVDGSTNQALQDAATPLDNVAGSGPFPAPWPWPYVFAASGSIVAQLTNTNNAAMNVRLSFIGVRMYH